MESLKPLIQELFARSRAGVFALRDDEGGLIAQPRPKASWALNLGLAARLQHAPMEPVVKPTRERDVQTIDDLIGPYGPLPAAGYELTSTDHLLAELYRLGAEAQWVLGLWRPRKFRGHWSGLCWHGSALTCSGLASCLVARISGPIREERVQRRDDGEGLSDDLGILFSMAMKDAGSARPSRTYLAGVTALAAVHGGASGDDGDPGDPGDGDDGGDLAAFVRLD